MVLLEFVNGRHSLPDFLWDLKNSSRLSGLHALTEKLRPMIATRTWASTVSRLQQGFIICSLLLQVWSSSCLDVFFLKKPTAAKRTSSVLQTGRMSGTSTRDLSLQYLRVYVTFATACNGNVVCLYLWKSIALVDNTVLLLPNCLGLLALKSAGTIVTDGF